MPAPPSIDMELSILKGAIDNTNEAFVTIDEDHKVILFNKAAERIFGYCRDDVVGKDLNTIMAPGCSHDHRQAVERYIQTRVPGRIGHTTEMMASCKSGELFPVDISFSVSEVNKKLFFTGIVRDLTETKAIQEQMKRSERLAALGQVVAEIIHEIKNPLMMIGGFARQLVQQDSDKKHLSKLKIIVEEVARLESLLNELKDFYLPRTLKTEKIDLNALVNEVHSQKQDDCRAKNIHAEIIMDSDSPVIEGDRDKLKQVLLNLVQNSIEAMENGGNLAIWTRRKGDSVEITVEDNGSGISEEDQKKIFSPFFTTKSSGMGLGLSISKNIIEGHPESQFTLESEEGKGTTFRIRMPAYKELSKEKE
jgi:two-component system sensor kinase FixL